MLKSMGFRQNRIAELLRVDPSTISRDLGGRTPRPLAAAVARARERRQNSIPRSRMDKDAHLRGLVIAYMKDNKYTPGEASLMLEKEHNIKYSGKSIYTWIWNDYRRGKKSLKAWKLLHYAKPPQGRPVKSKIKDRHLKGIERRCEEANNRERLGDFEADLICGKGNKSFLLNVVDRTSRKIHLRRLKAKTPREATWAIIDILMGLRVHTLTMDNGMEFSEHRILETIIGCKCYYTTPAKPQEKGLVENKNRLVRRRFKQGTDFNLVSDEAIQQCEDDINRVPMPIALGGLTCANDFETDMRAEPQVIRERIAKLQELLRSLEEDETEEQEETDYYPDYDLIDELHNLQNNHRWDDEDGNGGSGILA